MVIWAAFQETEADALRPLEALALEITQDHYPPFCWPKQNHKTSRDSTGGGKKDSDINIYIFGSPQFTTGIFASNSEQM